MNKNEVPCKWLHKFYYFILIFSMIPDSIDAHSLLSHVKGSVLTEVNIAGSQHP